MNYITVYRMNLLFVFFISLLALSSCKKDDAGKDNNTTNTYDCNNGNCEISSNGAYTSQSDCDSVCGSSNNPNNQSDTYECISGNCITSINGQYITLSECENNCVEACSASSFTDPRDEQTYKIVQIGSKCWFAENLRYEGNIQRATSSSAWSSIYFNNTEQPAWCYPDGSQSNDSLYGKLYNWYAVNSSNLCPQGWHVSTNADWSNLFSIFFNGSVAAGGAIKSTSNWEPPNTGASNSTGFSGLPAGFRSETGSSFRGFGFTGAWWSSTIINNVEAWAYEVTHDKGGIQQYELNKYAGLSCRCVKN